MNGKKPAEMHDLSANRSCISTDSENKMHDPGQSLVVTVFQAGNEGDAAPSMHDPMHDPRSCNIPEFVGAPKAAELLGCAPSTITRRCDSGKFQGATKALIDGIEAWQIPIASLPIHAQRKMKAELDAAVVARLAASGVMIPQPEDRRFAQAEYRAMWEAYERSGAVHKRRAEAALNALWAFHELVDAGRSISDAEKAIASSHGVSKATLWRYRTATKGHAKCNWLPLLSPRYKGGRPFAEFTPEAYDYILGQHKNTSETPLTVVLEAARALAPSKGWVIPSYDAVAERLAKEPKWLGTLGRKGPKAVISRPYGSIWIAG